MTVTPDKTVRAARAREALVARHAELQAVLDHRAGVLAAAALSGGPVRPVRSLLRAFLADEVLPHAAPRSAPARGRAGWNQPRCSART